MCEKMTRGKTRMGGHKGTCASTCWQLNIGTQVDSHSKTGKEKMLESPQCLVEPGSEPEQVN